MKRSKVAYLKWLLQVTQGLFAINTAMKKDDDPTHDIVFVVHLPPNWGGEKWDLIGVLHEPGLFIKLNIRHFRQLWLDKEINIWRPFCKIDCAWNADVSCFPQTKFFFPKFGTLLRREHMYVTYLLANLAWSPSWPVSGAC
jgi:hypothetical protein